MKRYEIITTKGDYIVYAESKKSAIRDVELKTLGRCGEIESVKERQVAL